MTAAAPDLGPFADWVDYARRQRPLPPSRPPDSRVRGELRRLLGFAVDTEPEAVTVEATWERDGISGEEISWSVGYGPRTRGWVLKPAATTEPLPGVLALHGHDGFKLHGKEKVADGPSGPLAEVLDLRTELYEGRAFANELARRGFLVLAHDAFLWGSRRFPIDAMGAAARRRMADFREARAGSRTPASDVEQYNVAARAHEHLVAKYCALLGTTLAGVVAHEDRIAARYLHARPDVQPGSLGCVGLSGGGCRAALLQATCDEIGAAVIVGMMSTHAALLAGHVDPHTWMFFPPGLPHYCDWPDLAASRAPSPLLVQYNRHDHLFPPDGMQAAHRRIAQHYRHRGAPERYAGAFYDGPHKFDREMQDAAFGWLGEWLGSGAPAARGGAR